MSSYREVRRNLTGHPSIAAASLLFPVLFAVSVSADYPFSQTEVVTDTLHGTTLSDPYRWLEDQQSPATRDWIERQNAFTEAILGKLPGRGILGRRLGELL